MPFSISRRRFVQCGAVLIAGAATADGFFIEPQHPVAKHIEIRLSRLPESFSGFRIVQISDIHFGPYMSSLGVERAVRVGQAFDPDLIVLTGDFVSHPFGKRNGPLGAHYAEPCADVFSRWKSAPILAILGNHDHWNGADIVAGALNDRGIQVLRNSATAIEHARQRLWIAGVDDVFEKKADLAAALKSVPPSEATVLLAHEPDYADYAAQFPVDLQLSGHSHGGQVRIPGIGPIILPPLGQKYHTGLNRVGNLLVYTSSGVGVINPPVRFNCRPEVTLITLLTARG